MTVNIESGEFLFAKRAENIQITEEIATLFNRTSCSKEPPAGPLCNIYSLNIPYRRK